MGLAMTHNSKLKKILKRID